MPDTKLPKTIFKPMLTMSFSSIILSFSLSEILLYIVMSNTVVCQIRCNASIYDERRVPQTRLRNTVLLGLALGNSELEDRGEFLIN